MKSKRYITEDLGYELKTSVDSFHLQISFLRERGLKWNWGSSFFLSATKCSYLEKLSTLHINGQRRAIWSTSKRNRGRLWQGLGCGSRTSRKIEEKMSVWRPKSLWVLMGKGRERGGCVRKLLTLDRWGHEEGKWCFSCLLSDDALARIIGECWVLPIGLTMASGFLLFLGFFSSYQ